MNLLQEQFTNYQLLREDDIPKNIWDSAVVREIDQEQDTDIQILY